MNEKRIYYFLAIKEILELFAEQELGSHCEIDVPAVLNYVSSFKFSFDSMDYNTKEEIYQFVTDDILNGYPIWQLLKIPEWTKRMLERELSEQVKERRRQLEKTYKCYTCKWFSESETELGTYLDCDRPVEYKGRHFELRRRDDFHVKKKCKFYEKRES